MSYLNFSADAAQGGGGQDACDRPAGSRQHVDTCAREGGRDGGGDITVRDQMDSGACFTDPFDQFGVTFAVEGWDRKTCYVLLAGVAQRPARVGIRKHRPGPVAPQPFEPVKASFQPNQQLMAITAVGPTEIRIEF